MNTTATNYSPQGGPGWGSALVMVFGVVCIMACAIMGSRMMLGCAPQYDTLSVRTDTIRDTIVQVRRDTVPRLVTERVTQTVRIPVPYTVPGDTVRDTVEVEMPVVQKEYCRDSLYRAWVTGIQHGDLPRLDSVYVMQQTVKETVTNTITVQKKQSPFRFGIQAGYGLGLVSGKLEPYVGLGVSYTPW